MTQEELIQTLAVQAGERQRAAADAFLRQFVVGRNWSFDEALDELCVALAKEFLEGAAVAPQLVKQLMEEENNGKALTAMQHPEGPAPTQEDISEEALVTLPEDHAFVESLLEKYPELKNAEHTVYPLGFKQEKS